MKIKILHLVLTLDTGGLENGVVNIINGLDDEKYTSLLCCIKHGGELVGRIDKNIKVMELNHYEGIQLSVLKRLRDIIISENIDIIHTRNYKPYMFGYLSSMWLRGVSVIHSEHGKDYPFGRVKMFIQKLFSYHTDLIIALSNDIKMNMIRYIGIDSERIKVIINGVDTKKFSPGVCKANLRDEFKLDESDIVIGAIGRLVKVKNIPELLRAVGNAYAGNNKIRLIVVGDGPERDEFQKIITRDNMESYVQLAGSRNDINDMLRLFDIYTLTSSNEGISNTLLEAMASGLPVVVSNVGGNKEIVESDAVGCKYESGDHESLTRILLELASDDSAREKLGRNARNHIVINYSLDVMIKKYSDVYTNVASVAAGMGGS